MILHFHKKSLLTQFPLGKELLLVAMFSVMLFGLSAVAKAAPQHPANPSIACIQYSPTAAFQVWQETDPHEDYGAMKTNKLLVGISAGCDERRVEDAELLGSVYGHYATLDLQDFDGDGLKELLFHFNISGRQYTYYIYDLSGSRPIRIEGKTLSSNTSKIEIDADGIIEVKNVFFIRSSRYLKSSSYQLINGYITLIEEHTKVFFRNGEHLPID